MELFDNLPLFLFLAIGAVALFSFIAVATWSDNRRKEREAFYRSETIKKIAEKEGSSAASALEFLREQERNADRRQREGIRLGGMVTTVIGIGAIPFFRAAEPDEPAYFLGVILALVGAVLLLYGYVLAPKQ